MARMSDCGHLALADLSLVQKARNRGGAGLFPSFVSALKTAHARDGQVLMGAKHGTDR